MKTTVAIAVLLAALPARAQETAQLPDAEVNQLCARVLQLMDAGGIAMPALRSVAQPLVTATGAACDDLRSRPGGGQASFNVLTNLRTYLSLADVVPKPYPFPDAARDQLREARDAMTRFEAHFRALLVHKDAELRSPDRDDALHFRNENGLLPAPGKRRMVILGDSILSQWRLNEYFPEEDIVNRAIDGQMSGQLLTRMKADVLELKPAVVVIGAGSFDLERNVPFDLMVANFELLADIAAENGIKVVFLPVLPVSDYHKDADPAYERTRTRRPELIIALNNWLRAFCAQRKLGYAEVDAVLVDAQGVLAAENSDDGLLPSSRGYRLMAPVLAKELDRVLRPPAAAKPAAPKPAAPPAPGKPAAVK